MRWRQRHIDGFGDTGQAGVFINLHQMAARVEVEQRKPQLFATLHFIYKGIARFFQSFSNRMSEVNQITVVGKNLRRCVVIFFTGRFEFIDGLRRERCGTPLTLVFGEQGKRGCVDFGGANCGICQTASSTNVRSNVFHARTPVKPAGGKR